MLAVVATHPVQYQAPVFRYLQEQLGLPVTAIYGSDFSVAGYHDREFGESFTWDTDLLSGYSYRFLSTVAGGSSSDPARLSAFGLRRALREIRPKAVLLTGYSPRFHQAAFLAAWRSGIPLLMRAETTSDDGDSADVRSQLRQRLLKHAYRAFARLLYIGQVSRQHYKQCGVKDDRLVFSPYCVDASSFALGDENRALLRTPTRTEVGASDDDAVVLFSGKLINRKRPDLLLQALRMLPTEQRRRCVALFVGSGPEIDAVRACAATSPPVRAHFAGFQNQTQLSAYFHASDVFVLPSERETWGLVVNEALHHGLPVVVSDGVGCGPDLVESGLTGEVFQNGSSESCSTALLRALTLAGNESVRQACIAKASEYGVDRAAAGVLRAYNEVGGT